MKVNQGATTPDASATPGLAGAKHQSVQVRGRAAQLVIGSNVSLLFWLDKPGVWLSVTSVGVSRVDLLHYAEGLRATPISGTEAFHFALLPVGLSPYESLHWGEAFGVTGSPKPGDGPGIGVAVNLNAESPTSGTVVQVGNRTGYLTAGEQGSRELTIEIQHGVLLSVSAGAGCSVADLIRFAAGITVDLTDL